jgi:hypothetical protein
VVAALKKAGGCAVLLCLWCISHEEPTFAQTAESRIGNLIVEARAKATPPGISVGATLHFRDAGVLTLKVPVI